MPVRSPTARQLWIVAVCLASLLVCCALAWWQWDRFSSAGGTFQNLGYVLQWPLFGLFPAFMFWRIRQLRARERSSPSAGPSADLADGSVAAASEPLPATMHPVRQPISVAGDDELAAYNRYLAELNAQDQRAR